MHEHKPNRESIVSKVWIFAYFMQKS